jgi:tetratricopeptide (TPR) repeat protein
MFFKILSLSFLLIVSACSSSSRVKINSVPDGATVTSYGAGGNKVLGKTPLQLESSSLSSEGRFSSLVLNKEGHKDQHILLGRDRGSENYDITINLQAEAEDPKVLDARARQERLAKLVVQAHSLTAAKRYPEAERVLNGVLQDYPQVSVGHDLMGNVAYLQKDLKTALRHYEKSLQLSPENGETRQMVDRLKGMIQ